MIEKLTIDKLIAYGFTAEDITHFQERDNFELMFHKTMNERYWASNIEKKIYSGLDASRKLYFRNGLVTFPKDALDLIPEYFEKKRQNYLTKIKEIAGAIYNEKRSKARFKELEVENTTLEIEAAIKEAVNSKNAVAKAVAKSHRTAMEIYLDWLSEFVEKASEPVLKPSAMKYFRPIPSIDYLSTHVKDEATMNFYEGLLQKTNHKLKLLTAIYELPDIFGVIEKWTDILANRLKNAPSPHLAEEEFRKELLKTIDYDDDAGDEHETNKDRYWNKYRKAAYQFAIKGQAVTLQYLGYLILKYQCGRPEGIEVIESISAVFDVAGVVNSLAEGAAVALFIHSDIKLKFTPKPVDQILFRPGYVPSLYLDLLKQGSFVILNSVGEYIYGPKKKSAITAFFDVLDENGIINHHNASNLAPLLNDLIPNLNITSRTLQNTTAKSNEMKAYFQSLLSTL